MITFSQKIGRLAEIRMTAPITIEELSSMQRDVLTLLSRSQSRFVICTTLAGVPVFSTEQADWIARFFRTDSSRFDRNAIVVGDSATFMMQVERLIREGAGPPPSSGGRDSSRDLLPPRTPRPVELVTLKRGAERRAFRGTAEAIAWLDEILTAEERARVRAFLEAPHV
jgi:hypothetical protein